MVYPQELKKTSVLENSIIDKSHQISNLLKYFNVHISPYSSQAISQIYKSSEANKLQIISNLDRTFQIIANTPDIDSPCESPLHPEHNLITKALSFYELNLKDDFWKTLEKDDTVEIYNSDGIQIFRTFNFFKASGYSLLDLLNNEWFILWERPKFVLQRLMEYATNILSGKMTGVIEMQVPSHVVKEISDHESKQKTSRAILVQFRYVCPLYTGPNNSTIGGFICSSKLNLVSTGQQNTDKVVIL